MTDRDDPIRDDAPIEEELRALPPVTADPEFRARLREGFVAGELAERPEEPRILLRLGILVGSLLAAAVIIVITMLPTSDVPRYHVLDAAGGGEVVIDGVKVPLSDREAIQARLEPGARVVVPPTATLTLTVPGIALFELTPGTHVVLPWADGTPAGHVLAGEVRFASGPDFPGRELALVTPDGRAVITGTLVSIFCADTGTCVCVLEGTVRVGPSSGVLERIPPGQRMVMPRGGGASVEAVMPEHAEGLRKMLERTAESFPRD
jgi:hypothetical protein